jgi:hypothetical protein
MEIQPNVRAARFARLEPGELFILSYDRVTSFALKGIDPQRDNESFALPLGPDFAPSDFLPRLYSDPAITTISFGRDFVFRFSEGTEGWSSEEPGNQFFCAALIENQVYLRANGHPYAGRYLPCWLDARAGIIHWQRPAGICAFCTRWQILLPQGNLPPRLLLERSGSPFD